MSVQTIPVLSGVPSQEILITLEGRRYLLRLDWLGRLETWSFSLFTENETPFLQGKGLVLGADLLRLSRHVPGCPQGSLLLTDSQGLDAEATLSSLGVRHLLIYVTSDES